LKLNNNINNKQRKMSEKKGDDHFRAAPPKRSGWESFKIFLWNGETSEFLGRTGGSWAKILTFYIVLYAFLAAFFAAMLLVFFQTLDLYQPRWQNANGLIGTNPGLGFRPMPRDENVESTLIHFKHGTSGNWKHWTTSLEEFLKPYDTVASSGEYFTSCSFEKPPSENKVCAFDIKLLGNQCTKEESFGYERGRPCIVLKLNRIFGWVPEPYDDPNDLPELMPADLKEYIKAKYAENKNQMNMIWVSCEGENSADREHIGNVTYTPFQGFPAYYFPYKNIPGYLSPIIALQFQKPEAGVLINIECKVWAKNIIHDRQRRLGSVHFEVLMD